MDDLVHSCQEIAYDIDFPTVRAWKAADPVRKTVGYFPVYAPAEIIHALGMLPVGLHGAGDRLDLQHADARFGSFICSIVKTTMEMGMTNHLDVFDALLFSTICDTARNLCFVMKRNFPDTLIEFLHLPHNPESTATVEMLVAEYRRLCAKLEPLAGPLDPEALRRSIELYNEERSLVRYLTSVRQESPHLLRAWELTCLLRAGDVLPIEEYIPILNKAAAEVIERDVRPRDSIRVIVEGSFCEQPPLDLIRLIEEAGCYIVDDDLVLGRKWFRGDVPTTGDPLTALATSYVDNSVCSSVRHDFRRPRHEVLVERARAMRADAVVFLIAKFCEPAYFDYVLFKQSLEREGIPHLLLEFEEKTFTFERLRMEVETFAESMLFQ